MTRRYTDFLLATAWGADSRLTAVAMAPCMRLYAFLGRELAQEEIQEGPYQNWILTYSSGEFDSLASQLEELIDRDKSVTSAISSTYRYAMLCERDFFQAAWEV